MPETTEIGKMQFMRYTKSQTPVHDGFITPLTVAAYLKYLYNLSRSCIETRVTAISERVTIMGIHVCGAATK